MIGHSVNRCSINSHIKLSANYSDFHWLAIHIGYWLLFWWKLMESHRVLSHRLLIYQSINFDRLISIGIDFDQLTNSSIAYVRMYCVVYQYLTWLLRVCNLRNVWKILFLVQWDSDLEWLSHSMILGFWVSLLLGCILLRLFQNENARNKPFSEFCSFWNWIVTQKNASRGQFNKETTSVVFYNCRMHM